MGSTPGVVSHSLPASPNNIIVLSKVSSALADALGERRKQKEAEEAAAEHATTATTTASAAEPTEPVVMRRSKPDRGAGGDAVAEAVAKNARRTSRAEKSKSVNGGKTKKKKENQ